MVHDGPACKLGVSPWRLVCGEPAIWACSRGSRKFATPGCLSWVRICLTAMHLRSLSTVRDLPETEFDSHFSLVELDCCLAIRLRSRTLDRSGGRWGSEAEDQCCKMGLVLIRSRKKGRWPGETNARHAPVWGEARFREGWRKEAPPE